QRMPTMFTDFGSARRLFLLHFFFFFSSRRRHTRSKRDWSSDVCSSDLDHLPWREMMAALDEVAYTGPVCIESFTAQNATIATAEIGRASCRERGEGRGGGARAK